MTLTGQVTKSIVKKVISGKDYRGEVVALINAEFLQYAVDFFKSIISLKLNNQNVADWYKQTMLNKNLPIDKIIINSGLNKKTITNMYGTAKKEVAIEAAYEHYDTLNKAITDLLDSEEDLSLMLTIKFNGVAVDLTINETLIVINNLAVKRSALRGGAWSTAGKAAENILMDTLCELYQVPLANRTGTFIKDIKKNVDREVDYYLIDNNGNKHRCEVKLMGRGNPESADAIFARSSEIFIADTLSKQNKNQAEKLGVAWVALREQGGYRQFAEALERFNIPYIDYCGALDADLDRILLGIT